MDDETDVDDEHEVGGEAHSLVAILAVALALLAVALVLAAVASARP